MKNVTCLTYVQMFDSRTTDVTGARHVFVWSLFKVNHIMTEMVCLQYLLEEYKSYISQTCRVPNRITIRSVLCRAPLQGCPIFFLRMLVLLGVAAREISTAFWSSDYACFMGISIRRFSSMIFKLLIFMGLRSSERSDNIALYKNTARFMRFQ
jgi:hypothetical protein